MFLLEKTYDIDEIVRNNMHTHSINSLCSKPEMIFEEMVKKAEERGLHTLAITDHSDPGSDIDVLSNTIDLKKRLEAMDTKVRVLVGAELSVYGNGLYADDLTLNRALDYRAYSQNHYHLSTWEQPEDKSVRGYAEHILNTLGTLFETDRADCIVHPFTPYKMKFFSEKEKYELLDCFTDNELGDIMTKGEKVGCAWEIHLPTVNQFPEFSKRMFNIGKEAGVHFNFGTDAHTLSAISPEDAAEILKRAYR